jgi:hypothetical protein
LAQKEKETLMGAKFWRTFAWSMTGVLGAVAAAYAVADYRTASTALLIGVVLAAVSGAAAVLLALAGLQPATAVGKALKQFLDMVAAGIVVVPLAAATVDAFMGYGKAIGAVLVAAFIAALQTYFTNASEHTA